MEIFYFYHNDFCSLFLSLWLSQIYHNKCTRNIFLFSSLVPIVILNNTLIQFYWNRLLNIRMKTNISVKSIRFWWLKCDQFVVSKIFCCGWWMNNVDFICWTTKLYWTESLLYKTFKYYVSLRCRPESK